MLDVNDIVKNRPKLQAPDGVAIDWGLSEPLIRWLDKTARGRTIETGAGVSTVLCLANGCHHTAIDPGREIFDRITAYCNEKGVETVRAEFINERAEIALPMVSGVFDLAILDGSHAFPDCFLDWHFLAPLVRVGGRILVDDQDLWQCRFLADWAAHTPDWRLEETVGRAAVLVRVAPYKPIGSGFRNQKGMTWEFDQ